MFRFTKHLVPERDFDREIRAKKDAIEIISHAKVIHKEDDVHSAEDLINKMIEATFADEDSQKKVLHELLPSLFRDHKLVNALQGIDESSGTTRTNSSWVIAFAPLACIGRRFISIATFDDAVNLGQQMEKLIIFALVMAPIDDKETKSAAETAKTLATIMSDVEFRYDIRKMVSSEQDLEMLVYRKMNKILRQQIAKRNSESKEKSSREKIINLFTGVVENLTRRLGYYKSDIMDGIEDKKTVSKVISSTFFLYFLCILPTVAFGALNSKNTGGRIDTKRALIGEGIGGLLFAILSGQPFVVIATTAPIALCNKIVNDLSVSLQVPFYSLYACVGLFNSFFLIIYGLLGLNSLIKFSTRSVEEIFSAFIFCCFVSDAWTDFIRNVNDNYEAKDDFGSEKKYVSLLFFILKNGTLATALFFARFKFSKFLNPFLRETFADYALPLAVVIFSCIGAGVFGDIEMEKHEVGHEVVFQATDMSGLTFGSIIIGMILGFTMSILFFMDQGVSAQLVNSPMHKLKKGNANDLDFIVVAVINIFMSIFGFPWMHGLLPHSPLHVQSLAETEETIDPESGRVTRVIVRVIETRLAVIACHVLIVVTVFAFPNIFSYIPIPVLDGLFMYCAFASVPGNSFFERLSLLVTQQSKYPPTHYIRRCEQKEMHLFTMIQVLQLIILLIVGLIAPWPYFKMTFPLFIALLIPFRHLAVPKIIGRKNIDALDSFH